MNIGEMEDIQNLVKLHSAFLYLENTPHNDNNKLIVLILLFNKDYTVRQHLFCYSCYCFVDLYDVTF